MERLSESLEEIVARAIPKKDFNLKRLEETYAGINSGLDKAFVALRTIYIDGIISVGVPRDYAEEYVDDKFSSLEEHMIQMLKDLDNITGSISEKIDTLKKLK